MAVLSKAGCNSGACHGNASGKAGFKPRCGDKILNSTSMRSPGSVGRRVDPVDPDNSLILPADDPNRSRGASDFKDSPEYETLRRWLARLCQTMS